MRELLSNNRVMANFTLLSRKKNQLGGLLIFFILATPSYSDDYGVIVKRADTELSGEEYTLAADIDFLLSEKATTALRSGVSLFWTYQFKVREQRSYLWNKTIAEKNFRYRLQYHALLNLYRVRNEASGVVNNFSTLPAALDLLATLRAFPLVEKSKINTAENYNVEMIINFERDLLPLPLRPIAYVSPQWYLSSDPYVWTLKE